MEINVISGNEKLIGEKIRYIEYDNISYCIFSLQEQDDEGYEKLYINKIVNNSDDIIEENEWENLKKIIPSIVKQIKSNSIIDFNDLNLNDIEEVDLNYSKPFKLKSNIVSSIKKEKDIDKIEEELESLIGNITLNEKNDINELDAFLNNYEEELNKIELPIRPDIVQNEPEKDLNELLEQEKNKNEELNDKIIELEKQLADYKEKIERIKIMLEA